MIYFLELPSVDIVTQTAPEKWTIDTQTTPLQAQRYRSQVIKETRDVSMDTINRDDPPKPIKVSNYLLLSFQCIY